VQRLLNEVLVPEAHHPGFFDVLVVDEAHHCAPSLDSILVVRGLVVMG
jgi:type I site-specific restriction endonuclease